MPVQASYPVMVFDLPEKIFFRLNPAVNKKRTCCTTHLRNHAQIMIYENNCTLGFLPCGHFLLVRL